MSYADYGQIWTDGREQTLLDALPLELQQPSASLTLANFANKCFG